MRVLALVACCLSGCFGAVAVPASRLVVPESLSIDDAVFTRTTTAILRIENTGTAPATVAVDVEAPFAVPGRMHTVRAQSAANIVVQFSPPDYAAAAGQLQVRLGLETWAVALSATVSRDADGDGHEALGVGGDDCDDLKGQVFPGAPEVCDDLDNDCNDAVDDVALPPTWYRDGDGDGFGSSSAAVSGCDGPNGYVTNDDDCDDTRSSVNPDASEVWYDGVDQDCDGRSDYDADLDGYDIASAGGGDCVDTNPTIHPDAAEVWYDGIDQDCDLASDYDADRDGHDADAFGGDDCDDADAEVYPGATELDDGVDQDCDTRIDETFVAVGDLVVCELMVSPAAVAAADGQYVEIVNQSSRDIDLVGFEVTSDAGTAVLDSVSLAPGDVAVLCANDDGSANGGIACDGVLAGVLDVDDRLSVDGDMVIDDVDWAGWVVPTGASLELGTPDAVSNDLESAWCTATSDLGSGDLGTPGVLGTCD